MERVVVLGPAGAGKSDVSDRLARQTGLPVVHLDVLFWRPGWTPAPAMESSQALKSAIAGDRWILDGNFLSADGGGSRFERADTVVFLDVPRRTCLWRVLKRVVRGRRRSRPDLPEGCTEGVNLELLRWIWRYPRDSRPRVLELLASLRPPVAVHRLRSQADVERFLQDSAMGKRPARGPTARRRA